MKNKIITAIAAVVAIIIFGAAFLNNDLSSLISDNDSISETSDISRTSGSSETSGTSNTSDADTTETYYFRNDQLLSSHYEKHGKEMGFSTKEAYQKAASAVIENPAALHKKESEDNDDVYYIESTREFVILSGDGYIRTYYYADKDYFERQ